METEVPWLRTERLLLRRWRDGDLAPFAALNADPAVMEHLPAVLDREQSDAMVRRIEARFVTEGFGLWAVELAGEVPFIGFVGLSRPQFEAHFTPAVEVGWRLARPHWGLGYATEAARAALAFGFGPLGLAEIVSFTVPGNLRSRAVMERLGMTCDPADDFAHPLLDRDHPLRTHVLYRLKAPPTTDSPPDAQSDADRRARSHTREETGERARGFPSTERARVRRFPGAATVVLTSASPDFGGLAPRQGTPTPRDLHVLSAEGGKSG